MDDTQATIIDSSNRIIASKIRKIEDRFDAEHDLPSAGQPDVTWVDMELVILLKAAVSRIVALEDRVRILERNQHA